MTSFWSFLCRAAMEPRTRKRVTIAYCVTLFVVMHVPVPQTPDIVPGLDKLVHFGTYSVLAILLATWPVSTENGSCSARSSQAGLGLLAVLIALYAGIDELLQMPVGRTPDLMDWFADICGAACGLTAVFVCRWAGISLLPRRA